MKSCLLREEIGGELLDVCFLVKEKVILGLFEFDSQEVMAIAFVSHFPAFLYLGGKVTIKRMVVVESIENAQVINIDTEM